MDLISSSLGQRMKDILEIATITLSIERVQPYDSPTTNEETSKRQDQHINLEPREGKHEK